MSRSPRAALGLAAALAGIGAAGCGSTSSHPASGAPTAATRQAEARFIAGAQAICRAVSAQQKPLRARQESLKSLPPAVSDRDFVALADEVVTLSSSAYTHLSALPRPAGERAEIEKLLAAYQGQTRDAANLAYAVAHKEDPVGEAAAGALKHSIEVNAHEAARLGMGACMEGE